MEQVFNEYANFYDLYYNDKDYKAEVDFILKLAAQEKVTPKSLLDMGCGTGRHMLEFTSRGVSTDGFDLSATMLEQAKSKGVPHDRLWQGEITTFRNEKIYDMVISMFAVMGYLSDRESLLTGLKTAHCHLKPGGLFIFDAWYGPAVLAIGPTKRVHEYVTDRGKVIRTAAPKLTVENQTLSVHYTIECNENDKQSNRFEETHTLRYQFLDEIEMLAEDAGFQLVNSCKFGEADTPLSNETWNACFVLKRR